MRGNHISLLEAHLSATVTSKGQITIPKADAGTKPDAKALRPFYEDLIAEYFPAKIRW